jgi:hypothetical protein
LRVSLEQIQSYFPVQLEGCCTLTTPSLKRVWIPRAQSRGKSSMVRRNVQLQQEKAGSHWRVRKHHSQTLELPYQDFKESLPQSPALIQVENRLEIQRLVILKVNNLE